ncbi:type II secretion system protein N [Thalassotalea euphylliae]|uniref:type II secretion system protein N n=1 Tax=Thalassotalea euphylliae TaxID=1655234 RepID=UPI0036369557
MKLKILFAVAFIAAYLVFIVAKIPASIATAWFSAPKHMSIGNVYGTVWGANIDAIKYQNFLIHDVKSELSALSLLMIAPSTSLTFGDALLGGPQGHADITLSSSGISLENTQVTIAASEIVPYLPLPIPVEAFGQVTLELTELAIVDNQCQAAKGVLTWNRAAVTSLEQTVELGGFTADIRCQDSKLALAVSPDNKLGLEYVALIGIDGKTSGQGYLTPGADFPAQWRQGLSFIGNPDSQGRYALNF